MVFIQVEKFRTLGVVVYIFHLHFNGTCLLTWCPELLWIYQNTPLLVLALVESTIFSRGEVLLVCLVRHNTEQEGRKK